MSEDNMVPEIENSEPDVVKERKRRPNRQVSDLAKEAESFLKGFNDKNETPEGRRTTRTSLRGSTAPVDTPPPAKKERKSANADSGNKRGRSKKVQDKSNDNTEVENEDQVNSENNERGDAVENESDNPDVGTSNGITEGEEETVQEDKEVEGNNVSEAEDASTAAAEENDKESVSVETAPK